MQPLVSIIIPVYNQAQKLASALDSIKKQTCKNIEIIIVDDGSEKKFKVQSSKFKGGVQLVRQENKGAPAARNKGFQLSKGEYVIFWDADIVALDSTMIEKMLTVLEENSGASYAYSDFYFGNKKMYAGAFDPERLRQVNYITTTSLLRRKDFPGFDESLTKFQDWDLWLTLLGQGKQGMHVPGYFFCITPGGTMSRWLPSAAYKKPWKWFPGILKTVKRYEEAKKNILEKHHLI